MPLVSPPPYVPWRQFDDNGDPLAGGLFYAYDAGTDTPKATYHDPAGTTLNPHPVVLDDAGYANIYLISGASYKLVQQDAGGVQLWEVDQVVPPGQGGAAQAAPFLLTAIPGGAPLVHAAAWQPGWRQIGVTARVTMSFGTSQGLQELAIGDAVQFDRWGYCGLSAGSTTEASDFLTGDSPWTATAQDVLVTPVGGAFDSAGALELTLYYFTLE